MIFHENHLPADDSQEISCLILIFIIFEKKKRQIIGGALRLKTKPYILVHMMFTTFRHVVHE